MLTHRRLLLPLTALSASIPAVALAHPGHHHHETAGLLQGLLHPLTGADHLLAALLIGALAITLTNTHRWQLPAAFVTALSIGAFASLAGLSIPAVHLFSALSVVLFGTALALGLKSPRIAALSAVSLAGLFHGGAHVEALSSLNTSSALFAGALVVATALLHLSGALLARRFFAADAPNQLPRFAGITAAMAGIFLATLQII